MEDRAGSAADARVTAARPDARVAAGRLGAKLFFAAGLVTIVNNFIPPIDHLNRPVLFAIGGSAIGWSLISWFAPWQRLHVRSPMLLTLVALGHIAAGNIYGGVSEYSYAVYYVVAFVYLGLSQPPFASLWMAAPATLAYVSPALLVPETPVIATFSATVAIPVCVLVGEVIARATNRTRTAQIESEHRANLLRTVAAGASTLSALDTDEVIERVVDVALQLGYEGAELCVYDEVEGTFTAVASRGLPDAYVSKPHPIGTGVAGAVRRERRTLVVGDYSTSPDAAEELRGIGYGAVIATPIWSGGRLDAALIAGALGPRTICREDVEAFELLGVQAGRALDNARRYDQERRAAERLGQVDNLKGDFISNVSHELRTPLTVIEGVGATLANRWTQLSEAMRRDLVDRLNRNALALDDIITSLLDFSRLSSGGFDVRPQDLELRSLCASVAARLRSLFDRHDLVLELPDTAIVEADPVMLERVVENLLANAVRHTPPGTRIVLSVKRENAHVEVCVSDDGPGIAEADLDQIGHRFFRGGDPNSRRSGGTGLGLALSREILLRHGSALEIFSRPGRGSRFGFSLPVVVPDTEATSPDPAGDRRIAD